MPFYEFKCPRCAREFEEFVPLGTKTAPCAHCSPPYPAGSKQMVHADRILSPTPTSFVFASRVKKQ